MQEFSSLDPIWKFVVSVWGAITLTGLLAVLGFLTKLYFDRKTARKTAYERASFRTRSESENPGSISQLLKT